MDCSPPGSSNHGIFQARVLEWGAIAFSIEAVWCLSNHWLQLLTSILQSRCTMNIVIVWFLTEGCFAPTGGIWKCLGRFLALATEKGRSHNASWLDSRDAAKNPSVHRTHPPNKEFSSSKMPIVMRSRNPHHYWHYYWAGIMVKNPPANAGDLGDVGSIPGSARSPGGGNTLQYPCLGNPMDRGAQWATGCGVTKSQTQLRTLPRMNSKLCSHMLPP